MKRFMNKCVEALPGVSILLRVYLDDPLVLPAETKTALLTLSGLDMPAAS